MSRHHRHIPTAASLTLAPVAAAPSTASPRPFGPIATAANTLVVGFSPPTGSPGTTPTPAREPHPHGS
jgi:hypothetical protein